MRAPALVPSRALLKEAVCREVRRCMDSDTVVCIELVKRNEHVELLEYPHHGRGSFERLKTTIFAYSDRTGEHGAFESLADLLEAMNALVDRAEQLVLRAERLPRRKGRR